MNMNDRLMLTGALSVPPRRRHRRQPLTRLLNWIRSLFK